MTAFDNAPFRFRIRRTPVLALALLGAFATAASAQTDDPAASLPTGPKTLLVELGGDAAGLAEIVGATRSSEEWVAQLSGMGTAMSAEQVALLADYLALNVPAETSGTDVASIVEALPADGRELFVANCFSCHGVVAYYLLQDRDAAGWMEIFSAPYHRRLLTGDNERETFASYAAAAMPIPEAEIPEAWQQSP